MAKPSEAEHSVVATRVADGRIVQRHSAMFMSQAYANIMRKWPEVTFSDLERRYRALGDQVNTWLLAAPPQAGLAAMRW